MTIKLSNFLLLLDSDQEVTISVDDGIIYEGKLYNCNTPIREFRKLNVINVRTGNCRVSSEIIIDTTKIE